MPDRPSIWIITGLMAAGKSSVAQALAERLDPSVHLRGDTFRKMIVNGRAAMSSPLTSAAEDQLALRYELAIQAALGYLNSGFNVVYQDIILGPHLASVSSRFAGHCLHVVVLRPSYAVVAERDRQRHKTGYAGGWTPERLGVAFDDTPPLGLWLDTSNDTVIDTVDRTLAQASKAIVVL